MLLPTAAFLLCILVIANPSLAAPASSHVVHESRSFIPHGWTKHLKLDSRQRLPMRFGLKQQNVDRIDELMHEVAHPSSKNYGKHLTAQQVAELFAPKEETTDIVTRWLVTSGISAERIKSSHNKIWLEFSATVAEAEALLKTEYHLYVHPTTGTTHFASSNQYSLPAHVSPHVEIVMPTLHFDVKLKNRAYGYDKVTGHLVEKRTDGKPAGSTRPGSMVSPSHYGPKIQASPTGDIFNDLSNCSARMTPQCLFALYNFDPTLQVTVQKNALALVEYSPNYVLNSDVLLFEKNFTSDRTTNYLPKYVFISGAEEPQEHGNSSDLVTQYSEGNLDVVYAIACTYPTPLTVYQVGLRDGSASFNTFLDAVDASFLATSGPEEVVNEDPDFIGQPGAVTPAKVISTSYGYNEVDLTPGYEIRQCNEYAKLGMMGTTFIFSSGDFGVAGSGGFCVDPQNHTAYTDGSYGIFTPTFPSGCPWVTSVGATQVVSGKTVYDPESACMDSIYSGGGFSNVFGLPSFQKSAVASYYKYHAPPYSRDLYNNSRKARAYPDVSMNGAHLQSPIEGKWYSLYGTSASAPLFASIITLLNGARAEIGKPSLGYLNYWLYANPWMLTDITNGTNPGCGTDGFYAVPGFDPLTGLGTPNYPLMLGSALGQ